MAYDVEIKQKYSDPREIFRTDYAEIQSFFQYKFPPERLSAQSMGLQEKLTDSQKNNLYGRMLDAIGIDEDDFFFSSTYWLSHNPDLQVIQKMGLSDSTFICDRRKGFSQISIATGNRSAEHKLTALSRRLRDSFGHGRIGVYGDFILFEDMNKCITGRIVLEKGDLKIWKKTIEQYIAEYEIAIQSV